MRRYQRAALLLLFAPLLSSPAVSEEADLAAELRSALQSTDLRVLSEAERERASGTLDRWLDRLILKARRRENAAWGDVSTREEWEAFRDARLERLRRSLGSDVTARVARPRTRVVNVLEGDGYRVENIVIETRPGLWMPANLYLPAPSRESMPGIVISHSHHRPKTQGELQDMGMTWARAGCAVLVPDMLGHGERREHPFDDVADWSASFRVSRQDYYFRYPLGMHLHLAGESLMGWIVRDLVRSVDWLLARGDVDPDRIILIGAVAGGGDPAGVTAALDGRIDAVVPFNFGGPQPDYAIPDDPADNFYWFGVPYWESTRALRLGARHGFAQWTIVASVAPRRLVYAHEFRWERERDPAWPRIQRVYSLLDSSDHLGWAMGRGELRGRPPESSHCTNVGRLHREGLHPLLERWFGIEAEEFRDRRSPEALQCLSAELAKELGCKSAHALSGDLAGEQIEAARAELARLQPEARRERLRERWSDLLGGIAQPRGFRDATDEQPGTRPGAVVVATEEDSHGSLHVQKTVLETEPGVRVPIALLRRHDGGEGLPPTRGEGRSAATVVLISRGGAEQIVAERREEIVELLAGGVTVCLADLRGTGVSAPGSVFGMSASATTLSCRALVLGQTLLGARLRDLLAVLEYLRSPRSRAASPIAIHGLSLAEANSPDRNVHAPLRIDDPPRQGDPLPGLLALLAALYDENVSAVAADGLLASWLSVFETPFVHLSHDTVVPGAVSAGDIADLVGAVTPRPIRLRECIDARNRRVPGTALREALAPILAAYEGEGAKLDVVDGADGGKDVSAARWILRQLDQETELPTR